MGWGFNNADTILFEQVTYATILLDPQMNRAHPYVKVFVNSVLRFEFLHSIKSLWLTFTVHTGQRTAQLPVCCRRTLTGDLLQLHVPVWVIDLPQ